MIATDIQYQLGLPERFRADAAELYDQAFGEKFAVAVRSAARRRLLLEHSLMPDYAIVALADDRIIGIAGLHTSEGSLTGGIGYAGLLSRLGFVEGNRAALLFSLYARNPARGELLMDGIAVHRDARGQGVGGRLLDAVAEYGLAHGFKRVRLDVIDTNPNAQKLYARKGFKAIKTDHVPYVRWLLKFGASTTMELPLGETTLDKKTLGEKT